VRKGVTFALNQALLRESKREIKQAKIFSIHQINSSSTRQVIRICLIEPGGYAMNLWQKTGKSLISGRITFRPIMEAMNVTGKLILSPVFRTQSISRG
jgi:hypothetical protein